MYFASRSMGLARPSRILILDLDTRHSIVRQLQEWSFTGITETEWILVFDMRRGGWLPADAHLSLAWCRWKLSSCSAQVLKCSASFSLCSISSSVSLMAFSRSLSRRSCFTLIHKFDVMNGKATTQNNSTLYLRHKIQPTVHTFCSSLRFSSWINLFRSLRSFSPRWPMPFTSNAWKCKNVRLRWVTI